MTALDDAYAGIAAAVRHLDGDDLMRPTRCRGWVIADLMYHLLLDAQRALVAFATPVAGPSDVDSVTYWEPFRGGTANDRDAALAHARWVRLSASAYEQPSGVVRHWLDTAPAAVRAAHAAPADGYVTTQGHVLAVPEFVATLVLEATVHHLDLVVDLPDARPPAPGPLAVTRATLDGLLGRPAPEYWDDVTYALKGTGRVALTAADLEALGDTATGFPLLG